MSRKLNPGCVHPDHALQFRHARPATPATLERRGGATRQAPQGYVIQYARDAYPGNPDEMICTECDWSYRVNGAEGFVGAREEKWCYEHNEPTLLICDMFGTEITKGSMVVYPTLSGRSATLSYGEIVEVNPASKTNGPLSWDEMARRSRCNQPDRIKVQPRPYTSRWKSSTGDDGKPVTLTANAPSVVVL